MIELHRAVSAEAVAALFEGALRQLVALQVSTTLASLSTMRLARASAEKPPKTTEWIAPIRAQARMAKAASGIIGM